MTLTRWSFIGAVTLCGCSSSPAEPGSGAPPATGSTTASATATTSIGPIPVAAGEEKTVCVVAPLDSDEDIVVSSMTANLDAGSHHLVVSKTTEDVNLTPTPCVTFSSILIGDAQPLIVVQTPHGVQTFPDGVGVLLPAHQRLRLEAHYLNSSTSAIEGNGSVTFAGTLASKAPPYQAADTYIWGTGKISLAAQAQYTTPIVFQAGQAGTHLLSITTHEHRLGTLVQAWTSDSPGTRGEMIANDSNWSEPVWHTLDKPVDFDGTNGVSLQCSWNNTTSDTVTFGESALDEMCFVLGFYYPSRGIDVCIDNRCVKRPKTDAGAPPASAAPDSGTGAQ